MSQYLQTVVFRILDDDDAQDHDFEALDDEADEGYIYEVDLHYPARLRNQHDDYPLAQESIVIDRSMYSPTQQSVFPESAPQRKLTPNLLDKKRYVVHSKNLKLYVKLGLVVTKVHRVLTFKQSPWLKEYIDFNTRWVYSIRTIKITHVLVSLRTHESEIPTFRTTQIIIYRHRQFGIYRGNERYL